MTTGRHAIKTPPHHGTWNEFLDLWRAADEIEVFESAWNWDHFYPLAPPYDGPNLEGWTLQAGFSVSSRRCLALSAVRISPATANAKNPGPEVPGSSRLRSRQRSQPRGVSAEAWPVWCRCRSRLTLKPMVRLASVFVREASKSQDGCRLRHPGQRLS